MYKPYKNFHNRTVVPSPNVTVVCSVPVADGILNPQELLEFIIERLNRTRKNKILKNLYKGELKNDSVLFTSNIPMAKRYIKNYLNKFLHVNELKDYIRVVAQKKIGYVLKYYRIQEEEKDEE